jgi:hypothetical protein
MLNSKNKGTHVDRATPFFKSARLIVLYAGEDSSVRGCEVELGNFRCWRRMLPTPATLNLSSSDYLNS